MKILKKNVYRMILRRLETSNKQLEGKCEEPDTCGQGAFCRICCAQGNISFALNELKNNKIIFHAIIGD